MDLSPMLAFGHLRLQHIVMCQALAEFGTLKDAATLLHRTQPALSKMLQELESTLGVKLFERGRQGTRPTASGTAFVERTMVMLNEWAAALEELQAISHGEGGGLLRVGTTPMTTLALMPKALARLRKLRPGLLVRFREASIHDLLLALEAGELDCVVGRYSGELIGTEAAGRLRHERLYDEVLSVVAGPGHPLVRRRRRVTWNDLATVDWVLPPPRADNAADLQRLVHPQWPAAAAPGVRIVLVCNLHLVCEPARPAGAGADGGRSHGANPRAGPGAADRARRLLGADLHPAAPELRP